MAWPDNTNLSTEHLDQGTDSPASARVALLAAVKAVMNIIASRGTADGVASLDALSKIPAAEIGKGEAGGVCELDSAGKIPATRYTSAKAGDGLALTAGVLSHKDTSSAASISTPSGHVVTSVTVDSLGHVTDYATGAVVTSLRYSGSDLQMLLGGAWVTVPTVTG